MMIARLLTSGNWDGSALAVTVIREFPTLVTEGNVWMAEAY